jgi:hypothetical protein
MLPLERDRGSLGVVLVIRAGRARRLDDGRKLALQPGQPLKDADPLGGEQLRDGLLLHHPPVRAAGR